MNGVKVWRYNLPGEKSYDWAIIFLDSIGCFAALSDWGDYAYRWNHRGGFDGDFRRFLLSCEDSYLLAKLDPHKEYDPERTLQSVKEEILRARRSRQLTRNEAREEWEGLAYDNNLWEEYDFVRWMENTHLEEQELRCTRHSPQAVAFVEKVIPRLRKAMQAELDAEGTQ